MSEVLQCDNPSCEKLAKKSGNHNFITLQTKGYKYYHVCNWVCLQGFSESFDPIDGPEEE